MDILLLKPIQTCFIAQITDKQHHPTLTNNYLEIILGLVIFSEINPPMGWETTTLYMHVSPRLQEEIS